MSNGFSRIINDLVGLVDEEDLVVTSAIVQLENDDGYIEDEVYVGRVEYDGEVRGVIGYDGVEEALERAANQMHDFLDGEEEEDDDEVEEDNNISTRHIQSFIATMDEIGFDRAIALLESLNN